jgi:hypothetical protein
MSRVSPKKYYTFMIDPELAKALKAAKQKDGVPEAEQIRRALKAWFYKRRSKKAERKRASTRQRP